MAQDLKNRTVLAKARAKGRPGLGPDKALTVLMMVEGPLLGGAPKEILEALAGKVCETLAKPLSRPGRDKALGEYEWMEVLKTDASWSG